MLPIIEEILAPFDACPHWGKLFTMPATRIQALYEKLPDFQHLLRRGEIEAVIGLVAIPDAVESPFAVVEML